MSPEKMDRRKVELTSLSPKDEDSLEAYREHLLRLAKQLPDGYVTEEALIDLLILGIGQEDVTPSVSTPEIIRCSHGTSQSVVEATLQAKAVSIGDF